MFPQQGPSGIVAWHEAPRVVYRRPNGALDNCVRHEADANRNRELAV